jgi:integrase
MRRTTKLNKLKEIQVKNAKAKSVLGDGGGLYLRNRCWVFRFTSPITGKERDLSLGSTLSLKEARENAAEYRKVLDTKTDPFDYLAQRRAAEVAKKAKNVTFGEIAARWMEAKLGDRKSPKNRRAIRAAIETHTKPLTDVPMIAINSAMIADAVKPLTDRPAQREHIVSLIHVTFDWAMAADLIPEGLNPARASKLGQLLPERKTEVRHNRFVPLGSLPSFMAKLSTLPGNLARCLEFVIHTALRQNEAVNLRWDWVNLADRSILIPGAFMKANRDHTTFLSDYTFTLVMNMLPQRRDGGLVFPGSSVSGGCGLRSLHTFITDHFPEAGQVQIHGCRSSFKGWATNTNQNRLAVEICLAHTTGNAVEMAYLDANDIRKAREAVYNGWSSFLANGAPSMDAANVVPLRHAAQ